VNHFSELGLSPDTLKALDELGFKNPTPIQQQSIPHLLQDKSDLIGLAQTGTGKTAAFALPLLEFIDLEQKSTQALILSPTRELGQQIAEQIKLFAKYHPRINTLAVYGGASIEKQIKDLRRTVHVIIATPGRLIDLIKRGKIQLDTVHTLILDEADEMLSMGFKEDLNTILNETPKEKSTWLFSATMPPEIRRIVKNYMTNPHEVKVNTKNVVNTNIEHQFVNVKVSDKPEILKRFIDSHPSMRGIVFCRTRRDTQDLAEDLIKQGYQADALHGDLSQAQRDRVMKRFKSYSIHLLIATDVAARGIDVDDLTHVIHYALPDDFSYYTHRSGRTARAGKKGISLVFTSKSNSRRLRDIERNLKIKFQQAEVPGLEQIILKRTESWSQGIMEREFEKAPDPEALSIAEKVFADLSKSQLIEKLLQIEHSKLQYSSGTRDLNTSFDSDSRDDDRRGGRRDRNRDRDRDRRNDGRRDSRDRPRDKRSSRDDRGSRDDRRSNKGQGRSQGISKENRTGSLRYFINLGSFDGLDQKELKDFICHYAKIKDNDVKKLSLLEKYSYFDVPSACEDSVEKSFQKLTINGHKIRVNRD
jgi:ATP-dependent RNA helicase DeaD